MNTSDLPIAAPVAAAIILFLLSVFSTAAVSALGRITRTEASQAYADGAPGGVRLVKIVTRRPAAIAGMVPIRTLLLAGMGVAIAMSVAVFFDRWWEIALVSLGVTLIFVVLELLISPARLGEEKPVGVLSSISWPLLLTTNVFALVIRHREQTPEETEQRQEDQLQRMVERVSESEALDDDDRELLHSLFDLGNTLTREVMVPRTDMISIRFDQTLDQAVSLFTRSGFSRVPVTGDSVDDLRGVIYLKDVIRRTHHRNDAAGLTISDIMREPIFVPETKVVDDLMREMQANQIHIAMVVDEYGGIAGLVTIEDLVEEIVGEIADEHDKAEPVVEDLGDGSFRVPAKLPIDELGELFGIDLDDDDVDTAGGLFAKVLGRVPIAGARAEIDGIELEAEHFEGRRRRLTTIIAKAIEKHDEEEDDDE
ncbi:HlyC/CorC family transporter [Arcanobacterium haemolyticum]|nr:HlyC/CorC family transporter [Arcanobacterium haemolyticum]